MGEIEENPRGKAKLFEKRRFQQEDIQDMTQKLSSWREEQSESQNRLDIILSSYSSSIDKAMADLLEEVGDLEAKLSAMTEERNGLLVAVNKLSGHQMAKLRIEPGDPGENNDNNTQEAWEVKEDNNIHEDIQISNETFNRALSEDSREPQNASQTQGITREEEVCHIHVNE